MRVRRYRYSTIPQLLAVALWSWAGPAGGVDITVNHMEDLSSGASCAMGSPTCTLREAIRQANLTTVDDTIYLPAGRYELSIPGQGEDGGATGDLDISTNLTLIGTGADKTIIDANGIDRVFDIFSIVEVGIRGVTITGGAAPGTALSGLGGGGGIRVYEAALGLENSKVIGNRAPSGGGLSARWAAEISISHSHFRENTLFQGESNCDGSGILHNNSDALLLFQSTFENNRCSPEVSQCDAIQAESCRTAVGVDIENSTIAREFYGGFHSHNCDADITHSTIAENPGRGVFFGSFDGSDTLRIRSTVVAENTVADCLLISGIIDVAGGKNLDSDGTCGLSAAQGDLPSTDPELMPFSYYASPTPSYHPKPGSPVIDVAGACNLTGDQDGFERPDGDSASGAQCDLGSIEALPCSSGVSDVWLLAGPVGSGTWEACNNLYAVGTTIIDGSTVTFSARNSVRLDDGFAVGAGATFTAAIDRSADWSP